MPLLTIPQIKINSSNKFCGGYIYNLQLEEGNLEKAAKIVVNVVFEDPADYVEPKLGTESPTSIVFGGNTFNFYPISYNFRDSINGKLLDVTFIDGSFLLDKYNIGLYKRHGEKSDLANKFIIVGKEKSPCSQEYTDVQRPKFLEDLCDPYEDHLPLDAKKYQIDCNLINFTVINPVAYTFSDLMKALPATLLKSYPQQKFVHLSYDNFGSLRSVLQKWCSLYGFSYFWDNGLYIVDARKPIPFIDTPPLYAKEINTEKTLEGTRNKSLITYFGHDGEYRPYENERSYRYSCKCLTLKDLYADPLYVYKNSLGGEDPSPITFNEMEMGCMMAHYDSALRDAFWYFSHYKVNNAAAASAAITANKYFPALGDMQIKQVYSNDAVVSDIISNRANFDDNTKAALLAELRTGKSGMYFFLASVDDEKLKFLHALEQDLSNNFLGKFYLRTLFLQNGYSPSAPDPVSYIKTGTKINALPFAKYGFTPGSYVSTLASAKTGKTTQSFLMVDRSNPVWSPEQDELPLFQTSLDFIKSKVFTRIGNLVPESLKTESLSSSVADWSKMGLYLARSYDGFSNVQLTNSTNPYEPLVNVVIQNKDIFIRNYGLSNKQCHKVNPAGLIEILGPVQAGASNYSNSGGDGYIVLVEGSEKVNYYINKFESINRSFSNTPNTLASDIDFKNITNNDVRTMYLQLDGNGHCENISDATKRLHDIWKNYEYSVSQPFVRKTYQAMGIPTLPGIFQGLLSATISINEEGIFTNYTIGNSNKRIPELDPVTALMDFWKQKISQSNGYTAFIAKQDLDIINTVF